MHVRADPRRSRRRPASAVDAVGGSRRTATSIVDGRGIEELRDAARRRAHGDASSARRARARARSSTRSCGERAAGRRPTQRGSGTGRHTTSTSRLVPLPGGALLVDTPGHPRSSACTPASTRDRSRRRRSRGSRERCRFADCAHDGEPGCAVARRSSAASSTTRCRWRKLEREALRERSADALRRELDAERRTAAANGPPPRRVPTRRLRREQRLGQCRTTADVAVSATTWRSDRCAARGDRTEQARARTRDGSSGDGGPRATSGAPEPSLRSEPTATRDRVGYLRKPS